MPEESPVQGDCAVVQTSFLAIPVQIVKNISHIENGPTVLQEGFS